MRPDILTQIQPTRRIVPADLSGHLGAISCRRGREVSSKVSIRKLDIPQFNLSSQRRALSMAFSSLPGRLAFPLILAELVAANSGGEKPRYLSSDAPRFIFQVRRIFSRRFLGCGCESRPDPLGSPRIRPGFIFWFFLVFFRATSCEEFHSQIGSYSIQYSPRFPSDPPGVFFSNLLTGG